MPRNRRDPYLQSWRWGNDTHVGDWGGSDTLPLLITLSCVSAWGRSRPAAGAEQQRSCFRQRMAMQTAVTLSLNAGKSWRGPFFTSFHARSPSSGHQALETTFRSVPVRFFRVSVLRGAMNVTEERARNHPVGWHDRTTRPCCLAGVSSRAKIERVSTALLRAA